MTCPAGETRRLACLAGRPLLAGENQPPAGRRPVAQVLLRPMDATPIPSGHPVITAKRHGPSGWPGYRYCPSQSRWYRGSELMLLVACETIGFCLASPKLRRNCAASATRPGSC